MNESSLPRTLISEGAVDWLVGVLFAGFVGLLFLGYFEPNVPYSGLATLPLLGALALLFWANLTADRNSCALPLVPPETK